MSRIAIKTVQLIADSLVCQQKLVLTLCLLRIMCTVRGGACIGSNFDYMSFLTSLNLWSSRTTGLRLMINYLIRLMSPHKLSNNPDINMQVTACTEKA